VEVIAVESIGDWIRGRQHPGRSEALVHSAASAGTAGIRWRDSQDRAVALFLMVFARFVRDFGGPDFPSEAGCDWRAVLGLTSGLVAVWDFDYYQLSLRVEARGSDDCTVVLAKHRAELGTAADRGRI
jgi:hypothetical protein